MANQHLSLTFLGGTQTVTGSKFLLTVGGRRRVLVDCGLFQGQKELREMNWERFPTDPANIDAVVLTHAHMDHCGYLPALVKHGFRGPVYATEGTRRLAEIVLRDAGHLQESEAEDARRGGYSRHAEPQPLYTEQDVEDTLPLFRSVEYHRDFELLDGLRMRLWRAGHILGSASIRMWLDEADPEENAIVFSGDLGRHHHPVLADREVPAGASTVVIESTYGDREHPEPDVAHEEFGDLINRTVARGGNVLIPAFAVDRTEVVLLTLQQMMESGRISADIPIFVNSPMGLAALDVYRDPALAYEIGSEFRGRPFIRLPTLREARSKEDSIALNRPAQPSIIISASGMAAGGRVVHHLEHMLPDPNNAVVFTGFQSTGTRGRALVDGASELKMYGKYVPVRAEVLQDNEFSVHADGSDLIDWLAEMTPRPSSVYCVHGEPDSAYALARRIRKQLGIVAVVPSHGEVVRL